MAKNGNGKGKFALGAILGAIVGGVAALLTAPKSGKETRQDIKDKAQEVSHDALRELRKLEGELNKHVSEAKRMATKLQGNARKEVDELVGRAERLKVRATQTAAGIKEDAKGKVDQRLVDDIQAVLKDLDDIRKRATDRAKK